MSNKIARSTVVAAFRSSTDAKAAAQDLQAAGINRRDIYLESSGSGTPTDYSSRTITHKGGITGWFKSLFGAEDDADRVDYERAYGEGSYLLSVDADKNQIDRIEDILNRHSPVKSEPTTGLNSGVTGVADTATWGTTGMTNAPRTNAAESIPVIGEDLQVGKPCFLRGGVHIYSSAIERPVEQSIDVQEEHARVDRRYVNRPATDADFRTEQEQVVEVEEFAEQPMAAKQARVEEVRVGKEASQKSETEQQYLIYNRVVGRAVDVFGNELKATRWLSRQNPDFGGKSPLEELVDSGFDPTSIFDTLGKIEHGVYF